MPKSPVISLSTARRIALTAQGLGRSWAISDDADGIAQIVERLGYVQIDAIRVVRRAHHHVLWTRHPAYRPAMLDAAVRDRRLFEYGIPFAAYLPMSERRFYLHGMRRIAPNRPEVRRALKHQKVAEAVLSRIRREGPLEAGDFPSRGKGGGTWSGRGTAARVMKALAATGALSVSERRMFRPVYDLTERVVPSGIDSREPEVAEWARYAVRRSLGAAPLVREDNVQWCGDRQAIPAALRDLLTEGEVAAVRVEGLEDERYVLRSDLDRARRERNRRAALRILSPFDGLVVNRTRLKELFGFEYKLECYLPRRKRRWGYFCLPLLRGDAFLGRLDARADRRHATLQVRQLLLDARQDAFPATAAALARALTAFAEFNDCDRVAFEHVRPAKLKALLRSEL